MALSEKLIRELKEEVSRLKAEQAKVEAEIKCCEQLLIQQGETPEGITSVKLVLPEAFLAEVQNISSAKSLAEALKLVLQSTPKGLRPPEAAKQLTERGYRIGSGTKTPLGTRVNNELWRLRKQGRVHKTAAGVYKIKGTGSAEL